MKTITESKRHPSPAPLPQSLAWDGKNLWIGSIADKRIYKINTLDWTVDWETEAPGSPWGMTFTSTDLRVLCGETSEDDRYLRRLIPDVGFDLDYRIACPDNTGSQLGFHKGTLLLSQWYNQVVLALDENGKATRNYKSTRGICGQVVLDGYIYLANTADEETNDYYLSRISLDSGTFEDIAEIPFPARALAYDGTQFYTNHRAANETVAFTI